MGIPVTGVSELVLEVADLVAAERFYAGALGLPVVERWPEREAIWLTAGDRTRIGLWRPQVGVAGGRGGAHVHFALHLPEREFDAAVDRLREWDLRPQVDTRRRPRGRTTRSAYVDDPDGNCVELWTQDVSRYAKQASPRPPLPEEQRSPAHFEATARSWDASYEQPTLRGHWWRSRRDAVVRLVGDGPGSVLDVGCGPGRVLAALAKRDWTVTGVDPAANMIDIARERLVSAAARLSVARAEALPFDDGEFDAVVAVGVVEYTDLHASLGELARTLRPGGRAVIGVRRISPTVAWHRAVVLRVARPVKRAVPFGRPLPQPRRPPLRLAEVRGLLLAAGLTVEHTENVGCALLPDPVDGLAPRLAYRMAARAERSAALRRALGTQRLVVATKRSGPIERRDVGDTGLEPVTSALSRRRSPN